MHTCAQWNLHFGTFLFMGHLHKETLFLVLANSQLRSDKLCIYQLYYKGTSMRRLGHFLSAANAISAPIKGTTTKLPMITMPSETRSCSSFCISFKIKMNALYIFTVLSLILHLLTGYCSSNLLTRQITI